MADWAEAQRQVGARPCRWRRGTGSSKDSTVTEAARHRRGPRRPVWDARQRQGRQQNQDGQRGIERGIMARDHKPFPALRAMRQMTVPADPALIRRSPAQRSRRFRSWRGLARKSAAKPGPADLGPIFRQIQGQKPGWRAWKAATRSWFSHRQDGAGGIDQLPAGPDQPGRLVQQPVLQRRSVRPCRSGRQPPAQFRLPPPGAGAAAGRIRQTPHRTSPDGCTCSSGSGLDDA